MARIRFVKPEFFSDAKLVKIKAVYRLFYIGLFIYTDREGRFLWDAEDLKIKIIPYDKVSGDECLEFLKSIGRIGRYGPGGRYGLILNFLKHQYINPREPDSKIPSPTKAEMEVLYQSDTSILDIGLRIKERGAKKATSSPTYLEKIPDEDQKLFALKYNITKQGIVEKAHALRNWCESNGRAKKDYRAFLMTILQQDYGFRKPADVKNMIVKAKTVHDPGGGVKLIQVVDEELKIIADRHKIQYA